MSATQSLVDLLGPRGLLLTLTIVSLVGYRVWQRTIERRVS